jgi:DNA (cytosine-5)-methyltransferase 1
VLLARVPLALPDAKVEPGILAAENRPERCKGSPLQPSSSEERLARIADLGPLSRFSRQSSRPNHFRVECLQETVQQFADAKMNQHEKTVAEFFAGIGLMRVGLEKAGWRIIFANDIDHDKWEMYRDHFGNTGEFIIEDIHKLQPSQVPTVALATASFPCNDLSLAGARHGLAGAQSSAFWGFIDTLKSMKRERRLPPLVLLENVTGFLTSHGGHDFEDALLALNDLGFAVDAFIIDAARFVPQSRQRLFVIGSRACDPFALRETRSFYESEFRPAPLASFILMHPDINWRVRDLPPLPKCPKRIADVLEDLPHNHQMWWSRKRCDYMLGQMSPRHTAQAQAMIHGSTTTYGTVFRRVRNGRSMAELRTDGIAGCLRTPRGGSGRQILLAAGKGRSAVRLLTPRECARLMGADDFVVKVPLNQALFGFGDAVCVPVIEWIGHNYLNPLWSEEYAQERPETLAEAPVTYRRSARR